MQCFEKRKKSKLRWILPALALVLLWPMSWWVLRASNPLVSSARAVEGGILELVQSEEGAPAATLRLRREDGTQHVWRGLSVRPDGLYLAPGRRQAMVATAADGLARIDLASLSSTALLDALQIDLPMQLAPGWSPQGSQFAWLERTNEGIRFGVIDGSNSLRYYPLRQHGGFWQHIWLDEGSLLLSWLQRGEDGFSCLTGVLDLSVGEFASGPQPCAGYAEILDGKVGGRLLALVPARQRRGLVWLDPSSGQQTAIPVDISEAPKDSLALAGDRVVWMEGRAEDGRTVRWWQPDSAVGQSCQLPAMERFEGLPARPRFLSSEGGWAVWQEHGQVIGEWLSEMPSRLLICHLQSNAFLMLEGNALEQRSAEIFEGDLVLPGSRVSLAS